MNVIFIDTSVLCNILNIPGRSDNNEEISEEFNRLSEDESVGLIIPLASIIETGNHISHISDGSQRRDFAERFSQMVIDMVDEKTPWRYYGSELETDDVREICVGFPEKAITGIGYGDASIIHAYEKYKKETPGIGNIRIWSMDSHLMAFNENVAPDFGRNSHE